MNIVIDSSVFIRQNLVAGKLINQIFTLSNQKIIYIYITEIIKDEINNRIDIDSSNLTNRLNGINSFIKGDSKFVKNIYPEFDIFNSINPENINFFVKEKLERFFEYGNINVIPTPDSFDIKKILNNYNNKKPPFSEKKKSEFPDAISFKIIEDYFSNQNENAFLITHDEDFKEIKSNFIEILYGLEELVHKINIEKNPKIKEDSFIIKENINLKLNLFNQIIENELEFELKYKIQMLFEDKNLFPNISIKDFRFFIKSVKVYDIDKINNEVKFIVLGEYNGSLIINPENEYNPLRYKDLLENNNLLLSSNLEIKTIGEFEMSLFYEYEFPYDIIEDSIAFDKDEFKLINIKNNYSN